MRARLFCKLGELAGSDHWIDEAATIGRGAQNDIVLSSFAISSSHARIEFAESVAAFFVEDFTSSNGTCVDGIPVSGRKRLDALHVVTLGIHDFIFVVERDAPQEPPRTRDAAARPSVTVDKPNTQYEPLSPVVMPPLVAQPPGDAGAEPAVVSETRPETAFELPSALEVPPFADRAASRVRPSPPPRVAVEIREPDRAARRLTLLDGQYVIGRGRDCELSVDDKTLSRKHAILIVRDGDVTVTDLGSTNGTFVDGVKIEEATAVCGGQTVTFGDRVSATFVTP